VTIEKARILTVAQKKDQNLVENVWSEWNNTWRWFEFRCELPATKKTCSKE